MSRRHPAEDKVLGQLEALGIAYEALACDPDFADTAQFCERYQVPLENSANAIIVAAKRGGEGECACLNTADTRLDVNRKVCHLLGAKKASFASAERTAELTGMQIGGVSLFGLPDELPKYIDQRVMQRPWVVVGGGSRLIKIKLEPAGLARIPGAEVIPELARPLE